VDTTKTPNHAQLGNTSPINGVSHMYILKERTVRNEVNNQKIIDLTLAVMPMAIAIVDIAKNKPPFIIDMYCASILANVLVDI
jgi:hypothetical protein